ncbi:MAG: serine/threonine-protein phosphatase [Oscillibacter sp.]|nr:serine/threonine-protein phosphatase [Oscillibacter sp.]
MKEDNMSLALYLLFQILIAVSILGIVLDYATGQRAITPVILIGVMLLTACYLIFGFWYMWKNVYSPLQKLARLTEHWTEMEDPVAEALALPGMIGGVAKSVEGRMEELDRRAAALQRTDTERTETHIRSGLLADICRSALPRIPAQPDGAPAFAVSGALESPGRSACCLYDYFFLQPELLCLMLCEVPGEEIADALFLTSAQTILRNCLRSDNSLEAAVNSANAQLFDLGGRRSLRALVGTLDLKSGRFVYVNAGAPQTMVMRRNQGRYSLLEYPAYEPMGLIQQVSYRTVEVRLRQGDRLFFETSGLGGAKNAAGVSFGEQGLRTALNRSAKRGGEPSEILRRIVDAAASWVGPQSPLPGFAAVLLEYLRSRTDLPSCDLPSAPESVPQLTEFLRKQCEENGVRGRNYTRLSVMTEELFALCCRYSNGLIRTECAVAPNGDSVNIRMSADMGGRNPLENTDDMTAENAAEFIFAHADYTQFQSEDGEDSVSMACFMA